MTGTAGFTRHLTSPPTSTPVDGWRFIPRTYRPARRGLTGNVIIPHQRRPQPLSHGASRRDSSPFRGAKGWAKVCGVGATVYHDADTYVTHPPVRGGVLDAPWSCDHRADLYAPVRRAQFYPCLPRRARLASTAQRIISRGHSPRTILYVRTHVIHHPTPGGRGSPPYEVSASHPRCTNPSVTPLRAATAPLSGEPRARRADAVRQPTPGAQKDRSEDRSFCCNGRGAALSA